eukprot:1157999-Pelagomonas_calceolata.AAC.5
MEKANRTLLSYTSASKHAAVLVACLPGTSCQAPCFPTAPHEHLCKQAHRHATRNSCAHHGDVALEEAIRALPFLAAQLEDLAGHRISARQAVVRPVGGGPMLRAPTRHRGPAGALLHICVKMKQSVCKELVVLRLAGGSPMLCAPQEIGVQPGHFFTSAWKRSRAGQSRVPCAHKTQGSSQGTPSHLHRNQAEQVHKLGHGASSRGQFLALCARTAQFCATEPFALTR